VRLAAAPAAPVTESPVDLQGAHVLVVEPNARAAQVLVAILEAQGCVTRVASHHRAAIESARRAARSGEPFDAAVLDLTALGDTPGAVGEPLGVKTVVLTSLRAHAPAASSVHDVVATLVKPVRERQLVAAATTAVARAREAEPRLRLGSG